MTPRKNRFPGFTLIELMIVIVIVGILASIGYATYTQYIIRAHRADAVADLLTISQGMERYFTEVGNYIGATLPFRTSPESGSSVSYNIAFSAGPTTTAFTIAVTPQGSQSSDTDCGVLTLDEAGRRCIQNGTQCSNSAVAVQRNAVAECW